MLSDEEIERLATITPEDIEAAKRTLDPELAQLLNAKPVQAKSKKPKTKTAQL